MTSLPEPRRAVNPAPPVAPVHTFPGRPAAGGSVLPPAVVALAGRQILRRRFVRPLRIVPLVGLLLIGGGGGCAAVDLKTTTSVAAEEADWTPGTAPKVTATVALECTWHAAPPTDLGHRLSR